MNKLPKFLLPNFLATVVVGIVWLFKGPTDQELLANAAKALDFHPWSGWWSASFLGGASQAPGLTTLFSYLLLKAFIAPFGAIVGSKLAALLAALIGGLGVSVFLNRWTNDARAAWLGGVAYILGPQMALRLGANEHLPVVFAMVFAPWVLWSLLRLATKPSWHEPLILALLSAGMTLTFTKLAVVFAPMALLFALHLLLGKDADERRDFLTGLGRALLLSIPLAVIPLLPTLREVAWLALFKFDPFAAWQQNFSLNSALSWFDRGNFLQQGMPVGFTADMGGFYVGLIALLVGILALKLSLDQEEGDHFNSRLVGALKVTFFGLLLTTWLSAGPRSLVQGLLEFLKSATGASDLVIPLFWLVSVGQCVLLWVIWPRHAYRDYVRIAVLLIYLLVPGFRVLELFPFAHDIRAPWSVWQVCGSLVVAVLFGVAGSIVLARFSGKKKSAGGLALLLVLLLSGDYSVYLLRYASGTLPQGTYPAFEQICAQMRQLPYNGNVYPLSGRYFYLQIPQLTGKSIEQEAFNSYFGLAWRRQMQGVIMSSGDAIRDGLSVLGCGYVFLDKQDPNTPQDLQNAFRGIFPVVLENEFFAVLGNPGSLAPGFLAKDFVILPPESYAMAPAILQLMVKNIIALEMKGVNPSIAGFAGQAKSQNQLELLPKYQAQAGAPFVRLPLDGSSTADGQTLNYHLPENFSGWLVSTMAYHPDWTVTIDGKPSQTTRAEAALLGTYVPNGSHEVVFRFKAPAWYSLSLFLGALSWIMALAALLYLPSKWAPAKWRNWWVGK
jgi:Bacterial membrane protein YfhO